MIKLRLYFLLATLLCFSCAEKRTEPSPTAIPEEIVQLVDTLNRGKLGDADTALAMKLVQDMMVKYPYSRDSLSHAILVQQMARNYLIRDERDSLIKYASEGLRYFESVPYFNKWRLINHYRLAIAYFENGDLHTSVWHANKARLEAENPQTDSLLPALAKSEYLTDLSIACRISAYYDEAEECINASLKYASRDPVKGVNVLNNARLEAAALKTELQQPDSCYLFLQEVRKASSQLHERNEMLLDMHLADYFTSQKQWDSVIYYRTKLINLAQSGGLGQANIGKSYVRMAEAHLYSNRINEASAWVNKAIEAYQENPMNYNLRDSIDLYSLLVPYYIKSGNSGAATIAYDNYVKVNERFLDEKHIRQVKALETQYRLRDKEAAINSLRADGLEYQLRLKNKNIWLWGSIVGAIVAILIALWIVALQRQRRSKAEQRELIEAKGKAELEQRLLRTQMEPHFIFNSLSVLQSYMREGNTEKSLHYLSRFARLLRVSLEHSREPLVQLKHELDALENYLQLQQMRFENLFTYTINTYEGYEDDYLKLPPMLLQPFVENTIHHGFKGINYKGKIEITINRSNDTLHVIIDDNGVGINNSTPTDKVSISSHITRERLDILSRDTGIQSHLQMTAKPEGGTLVTIAIPIVKE